MVADNAMLTLGTNNGLLVNVRQKIFKDIVADTTMLTLGTNNGLLVCVSFGSFSIILYRYLLFLFHSFDVAILLFDDGTNETIYECMVITITRDERCYCTGSAGLRTEKSGRPITIITRYLCGYWRRKISYPTLVMTISTIAKRSEEARGTV